MKNKKEIENLKCKIRNEILISICEEMENLCRFLKENLKDLDSKSLKELNLRENSFRGLRGFLKQNEK